MNKIDRFLMRLRIFRTGLQVKQSEVAKALGTSLRTYQRLELGKAPITIDQLYKICEFLNIEYKQLAFPQVTIEDVPFIKEAYRLADLPSQSPINNEELFNIWAEIQNVIKEEPTNLTLANNLPSFEDYSHPLFLSDPNFTCGNKALRAMNGQGNKDKRWRTFRYFDDYKVLVNYWDLCVKEELDCSLTETIHENLENPIKVQNLNYFRVISGTPISFGMVYKVTPI